MYSNLSQMFVKVIKSCLKIIKYVLKLLSNDSQIFLKCTFNSSNGEHFSNRYWKSSSFSLSNRFEWHQTCGRWQFTIIETSTHSIQNIKVTLNNKLFLQKIIFNKKQDKNQKRIIETRKLFINLTEAKLQSQMHADLIPMMVEVWLYIQLHFFSANICEIYICSIKISLWWCIWYTY